MCFQVFLALTFILTKESGFLAGRGVGNMFLLSVLNVRGVFRGTRLIVGVKSFLRFGSRFVVLFIVFEAVIGVKAVAKAVRLALSEAVEIKLAEVLL